MDRVKLRRCQQRNWKRLKNSTAKQIPNSKVEIVYPMCPRTRERNKNNDIQDSRVHSVSIQNTYSYTLQFVDSLSSLPSLAKLSLVLNILDIQTQV